LPITEGWWTWEAKRGEQGVIVCGRRRRVVVRRVVGADVVARRRARWARARENIVVVWLRGR
jgi:hypothetical protein